MKRIYCSNCGNLVAENANFCTFCGAPQHGQEAAVFYHAPKTPQQVVPPLDQEAENTSLELAQKTIKRRHLSPLAQVSFLLSYLGKTGIILIPIGAGLFIEPVISIAILIAYCAILLLISQLMYNNFYFSVDDTSFQKQHGILYKQTVTIPYEQIQNVNIKRTLLDQLLGLARIDIETAGDNSGGKKREVIAGSKTMAEGHLPGVTLKEAREIHDILLQKVALHHE